MVGNRKWVEPTGPIPCDLMVIAEAPGKEELRTGFALATKGRTGAEFNNLLARFIGRGRDSVYCTNRFKYALNEKKEFTAAEAEQMDAEIEREIDLVNPDIILTLGAISTHGLLGDKYDMETLNGMPHFLGDRIVIPSFHPAAGFRDTQIYQWVIEAFTAVKKALEGRLPLPFDPPPTKLWGGVAFVGSPVAVDTETLHDGTPYIVSWSHKEGQACYMYAHDSGLRHLNDHLNRDDVITLMHNAMFDLPVLAKVGIVPRKWIDTMQIAFLLQTLPMGLKGLAYKLCRMPMEEYSDLLKRFNAKDLSEVPEEERIAYATRDPDATLRVYNRMLPMFYDRMDSVLQRDLDIMPTVMAMMNHGFRVDTSVLSGLEDEFRSLNLTLWCQIQSLVDDALKSVDIDAITNRFKELKTIKKVRALSGTEETEFKEVKRRKTMFDNIHKKGFNPASSTQLSYLLYDRMAADRGQNLRKTQSGKTTDSKTLKRLASKNAIIPLITEWKERDTLIDKSITQLPKYVHSDGRIHTKLSLIRVKHSGRLASSSPNLMAQPNRNDDYLRIRKAFVAEEGYTLLSLDYSGVEMRVLAHESQDTAMLKIYREDGDLHTETHIALFGRPDKTHEERVMIKKTGFGIAYQISGKGLSELLLPINPKYTEYVCQGIIDEWYRKRPGVARYVEEVKTEARRYSRVYDMFGRMLYIPEVKSIYGEIREAGLRKAVNMKIQGGAQGIIKEAMRQLAPYVGEWTEERLMYWVLQVHDDLIFECQEDFVPIAVPIIRDIMEQAVTLSIPIKVDVKVGSPWGEMRKYES